MLNISGIEIDVRKKRIKNMHIRVKAPDGRVTVSAPLSMSDATIEHFVRTKIDWIQRQIAIFESQLHRSAREYATGETLYVWGKPYRLQTEQGSKFSLALSGNAAILTARINSTVEQRERYVREWYREQLKAKIALLLPKWETITGLNAASWQTKYMTTRWGTCNTSTGKIWLNVQLAKKPQECLEYVILHELAHLVERRHDAKFTALLDRYMPTWREVKATLNA